MIGGPILRYSAHRGERQMTSQISLGEGWDRHAREWIAWSRAGLDTYDKFHRDLFMPLVPPAGRLTVDVGCGEGRVGRDLLARGHRVLAVDLSLTMSSAAAAHPTDPVPAVAADAARRRRGLRGSVHVLARHRRHAGRCRGERPDPRPRRASGACDRAPHQYRGPV